ncbi:hypothetical protein MMC18_003397 [Xylographa bjoerkii]|nr:hypothetical protein [Xylographa bjoerkii]
MDTPIEVVDPAVLPASTSSCCSTNPPPAPAANPMPALAGGPPPPAPAAELIPSLALAAGPLLPLATAANLPPAFAADHHPPLATAANLLPSPVPGPTTAAKSTVPTARAAPPAARTPPSICEFVGCPFLEVTDAPPPLPETRGPDGPQRVKFAEMVKKGFIAINDCFNLGTDVWGMLGAPDVNIQAYAYVVAIHTGGIIEVAIGDVQERVSGPVQIIKFMEKQDARLVGGRDESPWHSLRLLRGTGSLGTMNDFRERYYATKQAAVAAGRPL